MLLLNALKQREGFGLIQSDPFFPPCILKYRFPLKVNVIFLLSQQSVFQREVCCLFTSTNGECETSAVQLHPRCSRDGHGKCDTRDEAGAAQGGTNEVWRGQGPFTSVLNMPR